MHVTPLFISLHWLPIAARIKFKALMFSYKTTTSSAPLYRLNSLLQMFVPSRSIRSASECCFIVPSQRGTKSLSQTFELNVPSWWMPTAFNWKQLKLVAKYHYDIIMENSLIYIKMNIDQWARKKLKWGLSLKSLNWQHCNDLPNSVLLQESAKTHIFHLYLAF